MGGLIVADSGARTNLFLLFFFQALIQFCLGNSQHLAQHILESAVFVGLRFRLQIESIKFCRSGPGGER